MTTYASEAEYDRATGRDGPPIGLLGDPVHPLLAGIHTAAWLGDQVFAALAYAVFGIIPEGFTLFVGAPKIGKSWAMLETALALACGGVAFGHIRVGEPRDVLLLALEDGDRRLQDRCRKLLPNAPLPDRLEYLTRVEESIFETISAWLDLTSRVNPVIVLDTLGKVMPPALPGESAYARDYRIGTALKRVVDDHPGASLVVVHHDRKAGSEDFIDAVSGTHGLAGAADTTVVLARDRHSKVGLIKVTGRDVREAEYATTIIDGISWQLDGPDLETAERRAGEVRASVGLGDRSRDALQYVNDHPAGVTPKMVADDLELGDAAQYLKRLTESGRIAKPRRGLYTPLSFPSGVSQPNGDADSCDRYDTHTREPDEGR